MEKQRKQFEEELDLNAVDDDNDDDLLLDEIPKMVVVFYNLHQNVLE